MNKKLLILLTLLFISAETKPIVFARVAMFMLGRFSATPVGKMFVRQSLKGGKAAVQGMKKAKLGFDFVKSGQAREALLTRVATWRTSATAMLEGVEDRGLLESSKLAAQSTRQYYLQTVKPQAIQTSQAVQKCYAETIKPMALDAGQGIRQFGQRVKHNMVGTNSTTTARMQATILKEQGGTSFLGKGFGRMRQGIGHQGVHATKIDATLNTQYQTAQGMFSRVNNYYNKVYNDPKIVKAAQCKSWWQGFGLGSLATCLGFKTIEQRGEIKRERMRLAHDKRVKELEFQLKQSRV